MTTAPRDPGSIAPARFGGSIVVGPSKTFALLALLLPTLVLGAGGAGYARFGQLGLGAGCVGVEASPIGLVTRVLAAVLTGLPFAAWPARSEALSALLAGGLAVVLHALLTRALGWLASSRGSQRSRELLALGAAWGGAALAASSALDATSGAPLLALWVLERAFALWSDARGARAHVRRHRGQLLLALSLLVAECAPFAFAPAELVRALAALGPCLGAFVAALALGRLSLGSGPRVPSLLPALLALLLGSGALELELERARAVEGRAPDAVLDALLRELPPRALVIATASTLRTLCSAQVERAPRPDLRLLPPPWQLDARNALALEHADGSLRPLLRAQLLDATPAWPELQALAAHRAVLLEPEPTLPVAAARTLSAAGLWQQLSTGELGKTDHRLAAVGADRTLARLAAALDPPRTEPALRAWLATNVRAHATHEQAFGDPTRAARLTTLANAWAPPPSP